MLNAHAPMSTNPYRDIARWLVERPLEDTRV